MSEMIFRFGLSNEAVDGSGEQFESTFRKLVKGEPGHSPELTSDKEGKANRIYSDGVLLTTIMDGEDATGNVVQEEGQGTDAVMSQKAVTDSLNGIRQQRQMILTVHSNDPVVITDITQCEYAMIVISDELDSYTAKILPVCTMGEYFLYEYSENWRVVNEDIDHFFVEIAAAATYADLLAWLDDHSSQIASAADVSEKYTMPSTGIPVTDLAPGVQTSLGKADSAYQKPSSGIPATDLAPGVQTSLGKVTELEQNVGSLQDDVNENSENIEAIKANIDELGDIHAKSIDLDELPKVCHYEMFIIRDYAPDVAPDFIPQFWIDKAAGKVYIATATTNASSFKALN